MSKFNIKYFDEHALVTNWKSDVFVTYSAFSQMDKILNYMQLLSKIFRRKNE